MSLKMNEFEEATFALIQKMSPSKRLSKKDIPFDSIKDILSDCLGKHQSQKRQSLNGNRDAAKTPKEESPASISNGGCFRRPSFSLGGDDEYTRMSSSPAGQSEDSFSTNDEESRSGTNSFLRRKLSTGGTNSMSSMNGSKSNLSSANLKHTKRVKQMQDLREKRRKRDTHEDFDELRVLDGELTWPIFLSWWESQMADEQRSSLYAYHKTINTLRNFFSRHTWSTSVESQMITFLSGTISQLRRHIAAIREKETERFDERAREAQLLVMLEMHVLANRIGSHGKEVDYRKRGFFDGDDSGQDENLSTFLRNMTSDFRFIFMATDSSRMRKFLEEAVSDSFAHIIPRTLAEIYDELCVSLPYDLEEYSPDSGSNAGSVTHTPTKKDPFAEHSLYEGNRAASKAMMDTFLDELASLSAPGDRKSNGGTKVGEKRRLSNDSKAEQPERKTVRKKVIPETPEEKLIRNQANCFDEDEILETPMGKMYRGRESTKSQRLMLAVKRSEEQLSRKPRAAAVASERASRAIIQAVQNTEVPRTSKAEFLALNTPPSRPSRARANLSSAFDKVETKGSRTMVLRDRRVSAPSPPTASIPLASSPAKKAALRVLKKALTQGKSIKNVKQQSTSLPASPQKGRKFVFKSQRFGLTEERMKQIQNARNQIVAADRKGGEQAVRECVTKMRQEFLAGREAASTQRNRTGRAVKKSGKVYVSHILVNTYNHNKLRQNEPVCNIKGQIYFDKVESANLRWQHLVELKKRKLLNGKRQRNNQKKLIKPIKERSSDDSSTNGTTEATTNNQLLEPKREAITPDSDEEEL